MVKQRAYGLGLVLLAVSCGGRASDVGTRNSAGSKERQRRDAEETPDSTLDGGLGTDAAVEQGLEPEPHSVTPAAPNSLPEPELSVDAQPAVPPEVVEPMVSMMEVAESTPPVEEGLPPLWLYASAGEGIAMDVRGDGRVAQLPAAVGPSVELRDVQRAPWSPNGSKVARLASEYVEIYALEEAANQVARLAVPGGTDIWGWASDEELLVSGIREGRTFVSRIDLAGESNWNFSSAELGNFGRPVLAPDRSQLFFTHSGPDGFLAYVASLGTSVEAPAQIGSFPRSPPLGPYWSPDSRSLAYGDSNQGASGIYVWREGDADAPHRATAPDGSYSPYYFFSADSQSLLVHTWSVADSAVRRWSAAAPGAVGAVLYSGKDVSPPNVSGEGPYYVYANAEGGWLQRLMGAGNPAPGVPLPLPDYAGTCSVSWPSPGHLLYLGCVADRGVRSVFHGKQDGSSFVLAPVMEVPIDQLVTSRDGRCAVGWGAQGVWGAAGGGAGTWRLLTNRPNAKQLTFSPDGDGLAWVEEDRQIYFAELPSCDEPIEPRRVAHLATEVGLLHFLPR